MCTWSARFHTAHVWGRALVWCGVMWCVERGGRGVYSHPPKGTLPSPNPHPHHATTNERTTLRGLNKWGVVWKEFSSDTCWEGVDWGAVVWHGGW